MGERAIRTLIVDDEPIARRVLREELAAFPDIKIVGEAENGQDALQKIGKLDPDLMFLDLQMPAGSGFDVVQGLHGASVPVVVIVTAYDQHAVEAFEAGAVDYLLKPVSEARLQKVVERAKSLLIRPAEASHRLGRIASLATVAEAASGRKIIGRSKAEYVFLTGDEVLAFQAERELVWIVTAKQRLLATDSLHAIEKRLTGPQFQRVHRNAIVNMNHVRKMSALSSQRWLITLSNGLQLVASKRQGHSIRQMLHW